MPITEGAKKAHRASERKRIFNLRRKRAMHEAVKAIRQAIEKGDTKTANELLPTAYKAIDKAAKRGVIKDNTAARKKSRLNKAIKSKQAVA